MKLILEAWEKVKALDDTCVAQGVILFRHIFTIAPEALQLFPFKDEEDLYESEGLKKHGKNVIKHMDRAITDWENEGPKLVQLGKRHAGYGVQPPHFEVVGQAFIKTLEEGLGDGFTEETKAAYLKLWECVETNMKKGM